MERYFKFYHLIIASILAAGYGWVKYGFSLKGLFATWGAIFVILGMFYVYIWIIEKLRKF